MYATAEHTYLATQRWIDWWAWDDVRIREESEGITTHIHLFETIGRSAPRYVASGEVTGFLLNQFAMDEHDGRLRVASTTSPAGWWSSDESESLVTVLEVDGSELVEVGRVDGLGLTEQPALAGSIVGDLIAVDLADTEIVAVGVRKIEP